MSESDSDTAEPEAKPRLVPRGILAGARSAVGRRVLPPLDATNEFDTSVEELRDRLQTDDPEIAAEILQEAERISDRMVEARVESVERRAATLQGVVAIASTLVLTGGTFLVSQVQGTGWRAAAGLLLLLCIGSFALCGLRATQAASQWRRWHVPRRDDIFDRPAQRLAQIRVAKAAALLRSAGGNSSVARWKVTLLRKAVKHLQRALVLLAALALGIFIYALVGPSPTAPQRSKTDPAANSAAAIGSTAAVAKSAATSRSSTTSDASRNADDLEALDA